MSETKHRRPIVIGVTGGSGSGKTTVSKAIYNQLSGQSLLILQQDSYYNDQADMTMAERRAVNYDHPLAFDTDLMIEQIKTLLDYKPIEKPVYDYEQSTRSSETIHQEPRDVIIVEGVLILDDQRLRDLMDIKVFVDTDDDIRIIRRIQRDIKERGRTLDWVIEQYLATVKPMYHQFVEPTKRYADIIVPEGGENEVAIDLLTTKVRSIL
ncbi:uridine kinase [Lactiplantibacillus mudanjiangensis]|uniref:Uridine kinase n=1 Tax=Lactiplantibacillus mudanjiangensis TaxID=1296538 RepID=A0A660E346_9LACO|nr:uridine kinase [Lactiplantibacillus mudanjiangensis]VDG19856.1 uridine kinase [Lactobacillus plantarum JDM1] [Lactiplantibacillus mudanjiangensis]VDG25751.1 uridine kinase [Lactobacillus plantarum JDM1] [Lactiplantibacillus mudanjiangensis]VDG29757.1 uridine kinase [Lactobacillus plantarum JDM1] [Lactiplantibacillus mudanjiangensis]VDG31281.1 uridine kinase [Lactobacillus plantarum JDM1] [Lactiplantibacillus mudanjiangensis]